MTALLEVILHVPGSKVLCVIKIKRNKAMKMLGKWGQTWKSRFIHKENVPAFLTSKGKPAAFHV